MNKDKQQIKRYACCVAEFVYVFFSFTLSSALWLLLVMGVTIMCFNSHTGFYYKNWIESITAYSVFYVFPFVMLYSIGFTIYRYYNHQKRWYCPLLPLFYLFAVIYLFCSAFAISVK